nr:AraC family transcriptional regulator [Pseudomaricurvus alcaniphilus]
MGRRGLQETVAAMHDILITVKKFHNLLDYSARIGIDARTLVAETGLNYDKVMAAAAEKTVSARYYSSLYRLVVGELEKLDPAIPWAGGIGTDAFELMCHALITCNTLGEALARAQRFEAMLSPMSGRTFRVDAVGDHAVLHYDVDTARINPIFVPQSWSRATTFDTVAKASGLLLWHAFCGWLIGRSIDATSLSIAGPTIGDDYHRSLAGVVDCPVEFNAEQNQLVLPAETLGFRLVHTPESLQQFLDDAVYQLIAIEKKPASTSAAIKSLVGIDFKNGIPTFSELAQRLHMSESSLRRRLLKEKTSYQILKDEIRCATAIEYLRGGDIKITDLSDLLGYAEPSSFVRSFRNWTGMTPKAYSDNLKTVTSG